MWNRVLTGDDAETALSMVDELLRTAEVRRYAQTDDEVEFRLSDGDVSLALLAAWARAGKRETRLSPAALIRNARRLHGIRAGHLGLFDGTAGVLWASGLLGIPVGKSMIADPVLLRAVGSSDDFSLPDLLTGDLGIAAAMLTRYEDETGRAIVSRVLRRLEKTMIRQGDTGYWSTPWSLKLGGIQDTGVAHGTSGVVLLLSYALEVGIECELALGMLKCAVAWLIQVRRGTGTPSFPFYADEESWWGRYSWCRGDAGIALALLRAGNAAHHEDWTELACSIVRASTRVPEEDLHVSSTSICHGSTGNALISHRFWQATGDPEFEASARYWYLHAANGSIDGTTPFLDGSTGVMLALLAGCTDVEPAWDSAFLISNPAFAVSK